jgi:hypothetical protein
VRGARQQRLSDCKGAQEGQVQPEELVDPQKINSVCPGDDSDSEPQRRSCQSVAVPGDHWQCLFQRTVCNRDATDSSLSHILCRP